MFIAIEGLEGAGKTTIMDAIIVFLKNNGICCLKTNEPNSEDDFCSGIRWLLKKKSTTEITKEAECLLFYAARAQSVLSIVKPSLDRGEWVVSDRHDWSTIAYQAYGSGVDISSLDLLREFAIGGIKPDFTIYIDIDPRIGMERAVRRGECGGERHKCDIRSLHDVMIGLLDVSPINIIRYIQQPISRPHVVPLCCFHV